jgi:hypothetical protein
MFEAEAEEFQRAGIRVGADLTDTEQRLLSDALAPFGIGTRNNALEMARLYAVLHCFENEVRVLIRDTLEEHVGADWWSQIPDRIQTHASSRQKKAVSNSWLEGEKQDRLSFVDFGHLAKIIIWKWEFFEAIIPSQAWITQKFDELEQVRNFVAHNRTLDQGEYQRIYMYVADWNRQVGL